jgi:hypothetical protein
MLTGYRAGVALTSLALTLTLATAETSGRNPMPLPHAAASAMPADALYSRRALRRARLLLELRLLELRKAHLERVRQAILHHLSPALLLEGDAQHHLKHS